MRSLLEFLVIGLTLGAIYGLIAIPLSLVWSTTRTLDIAVGGYAVLGGLTVATMGTPWSALVGMVLSGLFGAAMGAIYLGLTRKGTADPLAAVLASVALLFMLISFAQITYGVNPFFVDTFDGVWTVADLRLRPMSVISVVVVIVLGTLVVLALEKTRTGRWMRACAVSPRDAQLVGIPVRAIQFSAFVLSGVLGGLGGVLLITTRGLAFDTGLLLSLLGLGALIVFGMRGPVAAILGGMTLGVIESFGAGYLPTTIAPIAPLVFILLVLAVGRFDVDHGAVRP